ncbi:MAG: Rpn family recombination-promoting nuclease/putative transposase [Oscillospiraceae bacterium]|nr:Rpn family recombination-promoting nuclease/putative transposase [Oscillospiraceae bacterium]
MGKKETGNREYKDGVFRLLFADKAKTAELYNSIKGTSYTANDVKIYTLENPFFFGGFRNDLAFTIGGKLIILIEHQASINPNMGLRFLLYIALIYEILINKKAMYKSKRMSIANPEFYVIYNGKGDYPEKTVIKLSDLYETKGVENNLELMVTVYNVNKGKNKQMMEQSSTLSEYAAFVAKVREHEATGLALTEALKKAIEDCIRDKILREFLQKHGGDVVNMLYREWNLDDALEVRAEERAEEIAENMLDAGMTIEQIKKLTKLPLNKIKKLQKQKQNQ